MRNVLVSLLVTGFLTGCFASRPADNVGFGRIHTLQDLEGTYRNRGEGGKNEPAVYLSEVIPAWSTTMVSESKIAHASIEAIEVHPVGDTALRVRALREEVVVREQTFVRGKDFTLSDGRIRLQQDVETVHEPDRLLLGLRRNNVELGLDEKGQGKYQYRRTGFGLLVYAVPVVANASDEVRFVRIK